VATSTLPSAGARWLLAGALAVAAAVGLGAWQWARPRPRPAPPPADDDPRRTYPTAYRNVRPEVRYVGDAACAECHADLTETYRHHPMARSLLPVSHLASPPLDPAAHNPFEKFGHTFLVRRQGDRLTHREIAPGPAGKPPPQVELDVAYAVGSGTHGQSFLVDRDGRLFQSPISWYAQARRWDLSPGYPPNLSFGRPIKVGCLFCHANDADHVADSLNRYRPPIFRSPPIGCERCHGPGELHVQARERGDVVDGADPTIVNPGRLEPALREAVCQQCHLEGEVRVVRRGRQPFDFRPGLPLHLFWSVFVRRPEDADNRQVVSHVEQMEVSRCFRASKGRLGCTSCHDPHRMPAEEERVGYYRARCLRCHDPGRGQTDCSLVAARRKRNGDDCVACHMPRAPSTDIVHTAITDHRVPRRPDDGPPRPPAGPRPPRGAIPIVAFHADQFPPGDPEADRDLGLALVEMSRQYPEAAAPIGTAALPLLETAVEHWPDDVPSRAGRGRALLLLGRTDDALADFEAVLAARPEHETALADAAEAAEAPRHRPAALDYWRRAAAVDPWCAYYRAQEARVRAALDDWPGAIAAARAAVAINPSVTEPRLVLIDAHVRVGDREAAAAEFDALWSLNPPNREQLRRWFENHQRPGPGR
jgi:hypothetical protein